MEAPTFDEVVVLLLVIGLMWIGVRLIVWGIRQHPARQPQE